MQQRVAAPRAPALRAGGEPRRVVRQPQARRRRGARPGRSAGTRPGRPASAAPRSRRSTAPRPAAPAGPPAPRAGSSPGSSDRSPDATAVARARSAARRVAGIGSASSGASATASGAGNACTRPSSAASTGVAERRGHPAQHRPRGGDRHGLPDDRAHRGLPAVRRARDPQPRPPRHQRRQRRVVRQGGVDRDGVGVQVEDPPAARHRRAQVAQVVQREHRLHVAVGRREGHAAQAGGQAQHPPVRPGVRPLHARDRARRQEAERGVQRRGAGGTPGAATPRPAPPRRPPAPAPAGRWGSARRPRGWCC